MRVLMLAGEASGDAHAAKVARHLLQMGVEVEAVGGPSLQDAGVEILHNIEEFSVLGFVEVMRKFPSIWRLKKEIEQRLESRHYDLFLPVDFPGLNLRLAGAAQTRGTPVLYYIGPQIWAWRARRLKKMRRSVDRVALILPFEKPFYDEAGIEATFVGHPLLEETGASGSADANSVEFELGLFPGSRRQELDKHLPVLLQTVQRLRAKRGKLSFCVGLAPTVDRRRVEAALSASGFGGSEIRETASMELMSRCRASLVASGTATLEAALVGRPFAVFYRTARINYELIRRFIRVPYVSLPNLIASREVVREYLQDHCSVEALCQEVERLLDDSGERTRQAGALADLRNRLGTPGASKRVADLAHEMLQASRGQEAACRSKP